MSPSENVKQQITTFLDTIWRVKTRPTNSTKQMLVISYLAQKIPGDREFTETQVNDLLTMRHTFWNSALLTNELYTYWHVSRNSNGTWYKRI